MTIKRRFFYSNIRMVLLTVGGLLTTFMVSRFVMNAIFRTHGFGDFESYRRLYGSSALVALAVFVVFFIVINSLLSNRLSKKITRPLDVLTNGVSQIRENNFSCRIEYEEDDEFRPVCEAFNLMAAQLEASTNRRLKDEANRRELLAGISHDLRTPLTTISGYLDGIESGVAKSSEMQERYFNTIKNNTANMKHIIEQLFLFSKLDMDEFLFTRQRFDIMRAISDMTEELTDEYAKRGLEITVVESPENIFVYADVTHLRRVVINILENSARYKEKETGHLEISADLDSDFVRLKFADDGPGVDPTALSNIFNVFYRADSSRHSIGHGLGLAICAKIIERSGGTIHAEPSDSGGLAVVIRLPSVRLPIETEAV